MIRAVANLFAGVIGILILSAIIAIAIGFGFAFDVGFAFDAGANREVLIISASMVIGGVVALISMGMACVLLDIMFNTREISENTKSKRYTDSANVPRTEPELG
jgi:hypothetical protein